MEGSSNLHCLVDIDVAFLHTPMLPYPIRIQSLVLSIFAFSLFRFIFYNHPWKAYLYRSTCLPVHLAVDKTASVTAVGLTVQIDVLGWG